MAKRQTNSEKLSHELVEWLIKDFDKRLKKEGLGKEELYKVVANEIGVTDRHLRNWLSRGSYPTGLYREALGRYKIKSEDL